jgi:hypothetical protein
MSLFLNVNKDMCSCSLIVVLLVALKHAVNFAKCGFPCFDKVVSSISHIDNIHLNVYERILC